MEENEVESEVIEQQAQAPRGPFEAFDMAFAQELKASGHTRTKADLMAYLGYGQEQQEGIKQIVVRHVESAIILMAVGGADKVGHAMMDVLFYALLVGAQLAKKGLL